MNHKYMQFIACTAGWADMVTCTKILRAPLSPNPYRSPWLTPFEIVCGFLFLIYQIIICWIYFNDSENYCAPCPSQKVIKSRFANTKG